MMKAQETDVVRVRAAGTTSASDWVAIERPLEIRVRAGETERVLSTTMRTPGDDRALAAGFLYAERVIRHPRQLCAVESVGDDAVMVQLDAAAAADIEAAQRPFVTSGACGVCGRKDLRALFDLSGAPGDGSPRDPRWPRLAPAVIHALPSGLRAAQATFARTGGLHAAGLFTVDGVARAVHEDVGRHNAVDKLVGTFILDGRLPDADCVLVVSGRASFELVQKAAVAAIPIMVAVGAPSSLAVEVARDAGMTLLGFVRDGGFNIYCGAARIVGVA
ncbi:MAG TPA: formate dehydrogenase accessory sulfurtransferase FdhD [Polyangia bacterium]